MPTFDGLKRRETKSDHFAVQGGSVYGYATQSGGDIFMVGSLIGFANISGTTAMFAGSAQSQSRSVAIGNIGSPAAYSNIYAQAGSGLTDAASIFWVVLPEGYANSTYFITHGVRGTADRTVTHVAGSTNAGSFFVISHGAGAVVFDWHTVGNK